MENIPFDAEFVVHLGDIRNAAGKPPCLQAEYQTVSDILRHSWAPVFVELGDNDWNDCPNPTEGLAYWQQEFLFFYDRYWNNNLNVTTLAGRNENYSFMNKGTLFIGVDMPGSIPLNMIDWNRQLTDEVNWVMDLIANYKKDMNAQGLIGQVVLFAHADPTQYHAPFFDPLVNFIANYLNNDIPIVYMNGDGHYWDFRPNFFGQPSFLRIMLTAETVNPPLKVMITGAHTQLLPPEQVFLYDHELNLYGANSYLGIGGNGGI